MKYRLNVGIMVMTRLVKNWPDMPVTVMVLSDTSKNIIDHAGVNPVINSLTSINIFGGIRSEVTSDSKYFEHWYTPNYKTHPEEIERYTDILHYLDFTGYCFKERVTVEGQLPTLIVVSNDIIVDRSRWESVSLENVKSLVLKTTQPLSEIG